MLWDGPDDRIEQVWFSGVHSNVGGGYPKQGMSLVALDWMLAHAEKEGLRLLKLDHELFRGHASVDDMMYDPRAGMGVFYRWAPRDIRALLRADQREPAHSPDVAERIAHGTDDYAPGNIPPNAIVAFTPPAPNDPHREEKARVLRHRAEAIEAADPAGAQERISAGFGQVRAGAWPRLVLAVHGLVGRLHRGGPGRRRRGDAAPLRIGPIGRVRCWSPRLQASSPASILARRAENGMNDRFSLFWQKHQKDLRAALKQAHQAARDDQVRT